MYPQVIYMRIVNPGTTDEYNMFGLELPEVEDAAVGENESVDPITYRYVLDCRGRIKSGVPRYVELQAA